MFLCECGCEQIVNPGRRFIKGHNAPNKGKTLSKDQIIKMSQSLKGRLPTMGFTGKSHSTDSKNKISESQKISQIGNKNAFKYGCIDYWHKEARNLFGKEYCEICGESKMEDRNLDMHCMSNPKDYTIMESRNWKTLCKSCHGKIDRGNKSEVK